MGELLRCFLSGVAKTVLEQNKLTAQRVGAKQIQTVEKTQTTVVGVAQTLSGKSSSTIRALGFLLRRTVDKRIRINQEIHVRICESLKGQFLRATRPPIFKEHGYAAYAVPIDVKEKGVMWLQPPYS